MDFNYSTNYQVTIALKKGAPERNALRGARRETEKNMMLRPPSFARRHSDR